MFNKRISSAAYADSKPHFEVLNGLRGSLRIGFSFSAGMLLACKFVPGQIRGAFWKAGLAIVVLLSIPYVGNENTMCTIRLCISTMRGWVSPIRSGLLGNVYCLKLLRGEFVNRFVVFADNFFNNFACRLNLFDDGGNLSNFQFSFHEVAFEDAFLGTGASQ